MGKRLLWVAGAIAAGSLPATAQAQAQAQAQVGPAVDCARLTALRIPDVRIVKASAIKPDPVWMTPLAQPPEGLSLPVRKPFCRVEGVIEDEIGFELWLPVAAEWTGRLLSSGNGGFAGFIRYEGLAKGVNRGFAAASTDTGHKLSEVAWPIGHPRRLENYGHRAQHLLAVNAKQIIAAYYGRPSAHNYFLGCSGGGMQGMNEVQKYPADYDGIIAGAHGRSIVGISARWLQSALIARYQPAANLSVADWQRVANYAIQQCDAKDGAIDGIIGDPRQCRVDPGVTPGLTTAQVHTARLLYGPVLGKLGRELYPGFKAGVAYVPISDPGRPGEVFAQWLHNDANWDVRQFDPGTDVPDAEAVVPGAAPTNPNLEAFYARGGKMISFHGWSDEIVPVQSTIDYYQSVQNFMGAQKVASFYKLYLASGMNHCRGGVGPDSFGFWGENEVPDPNPGNDMLAAMVQWVEQGIEPGRIVATKFKDAKPVMTRPVCQWPQVLRYTGKGDINRAENFVCAAR
ncbi:MAG: hypothetical protein RLZZ427_961 [Pseudomonadota bacterium]|jgi:feruloyl esterase